MPWRPPLDTLIKPVRKLNDLAGYVWTEEEERPILQSKSEMQPRPLPLPAESENPTTAILKKRAEWSRDNQHKHGMTRSNFIDKSVLSGERMHPKTIQKIL